MLADLETRDGRHEQSGWASLARGCFAALRNAVAHHDVEYTRLTGLEALGAMSLVARRVTAERRQAEARAHRLEMKRRHDNDPGGGGGGGS